MNSYAFVLLIIIQVSQHETEMCNDSPGKLLHRTFKKNIASAGYY